VGGVRTSVGMRTRSDGGGREEVAATERAWERDATRKKASARRVMA
jgi:hypothetical protein